jgi:hypothetical protein
MNQGRASLFGDDVFISYSRKDGGDYALALASRLTRRKALLSSRSMGITSRQGDPGRGQGGDPQEHLVCTRGVGQGGGVRLCTAGDRDSDGSGP